MFDDYYFEPVAEESESALRERLSAIDTKGIFAPENTVLNTADICFYKNRKLLQVKTLCGKHSFAYYFLYGENRADALVPLSDFSRPDEVFAINAAAGVNITSGTVVEYAKFILSCMQVNMGGARGNLLLVDNTNTARTKVADDARELLRAPIVAENADGFSIDATVLHERQVLRLVLDVKTDGVLTIARRSGFA